MSKLELVPQTLLPHLLPERHLGVLLYQLAFAKERVRHEHCILSDPYGDRVYVIPIAATVRVKVTTNEPGG